MLSDDDKSDIRKRLRRAEGQVTAIARMVEEDKYCVDVLTQIAAAAAALEKAGSIILERHLEHCVTDAFRSGDEAARQEKIAELMKIFRKYSEFG